MKIDREGQVLGILSDRELGRGPHFDPHEIALDKDGSLYTVEVVGWHAEKFRLRSTAR